MTVEDFIKRYEKALATQKWENVSPLIHEKCVVTFSNGNRYYGKEQIEQAFQKNFDLIKGESFSISELSQGVSTEHFAVCTYSYEWSGEIAGEMISGTGLGTSVLMRVDSGWQFVSEHLGSKG